MILRARIVVTMDGPPIENGAIAVSDDRVADVGSFEEIKATHSGEIVDLGECALLPGLINAHCHLDYTCLRGRIPPPKSFTDWIRAINAEKAKLSEEDYLRSINDGFAEAKNFGTTTIVNLTAFPELVANVRPPIRTWWFAELIDVRLPERAHEIVDLAAERLSMSNNWGLAPHALYTASPELFRRSDQLARRENILLTTHLAESREEMAAFRDARGALYEFLKEIGRDMTDCDGNTPIAKFLDRGDSPNRFEPDRHSRAIEVNRPYLVAHLNEVAESDFELLARSARDFSVVHCPRSHKYFGHSPFQFERLRRLGFNICLGTDSLASNEDLSLFGEMRQFQKNFATVSPDEILRMVTVNPARALRQENELGKIGRGSKADFIAVACNGGDVFEEIAAFQGEPSIILRGAGTGR